MPPIPLSPTSSPKEFRRASERLRRACERRGLPVDFDTALELASAFHDAADWNTMCALLRAPDHEAMLIVGSLDVEPSTPCVRPVLGLMETMQEWDSVLRWMAREGNGSLTVMSTEAREASFLGQAMMKARYWSIMQFVEGACGQVSMSWLRRHNMLSFSHRIDGFDGSVMRVRIVLDDRGATMDVRAMPDRPMKLDDMRIESDVRAMLRRTSGGLSLLCGRAGSGRTTLVASVMADLVTQAKAPLCILDYVQPFEFRADRVIVPAGSMSTIHQVSLCDQGVQLSVRSCLENASRRRADVIVVPEPTMPDDFRACLDAASNGMRVITTMTVPTASAALRQLMRGFENETDGRDMFELLDLIVAQELVPGVAGRLVAVREHAVIDEKMTGDVVYAGSSRKDEFHGTLRHIIDDDHPDGRTASMTSAGRRALDRGLISPDTFEALERRHRR